MSNGRAPRHLPIVVSIVIALMLSIAPFPDWATDFRPGWLTLTLIYWSMTFPKSYSVGTAWIAGLVLDVAHGTLLGQHALAFCVVIYITVKFHLQLRQFPVLQLSATVFAMLALYQFILFWINGVAGVSSPAVSYWGPVLTGTLVWPLLGAAFGGLRQQVRG